MFGYARAGVRRGNLARAGTRRNGFLPGMGFRGFLSRSAGNVDGYLRALAGLTLQGNIAPQLFDDFPRNEQSESRTGRL